MTQRSIILERIRREYKAMNHNRWDILVTIRQEFKKKLAFPGIRARVATAIVLSYVQYREGVIELL